MTAPVYSAMEQPLEWVYYFHKGPRAKDIPVTETFSPVTPMDHPEDDIQLPFRKDNMISTRNPTCNSTCTLMSVQSQDSLSNKLDRLRKSKVQGN